MANSRVDPADTLDPTIAVHTSTVVSPAASGSTMLRPRRVLQLAAPDVEPADAVAIDQGRVAVAERLTAPPALPAPLPAPVALASPVVPPPLTAPPQPTAMLAEPAFALVEPKAALAEPIVAPEPGASDPEPATTSATPVLRLTQAPPVRVPSQPIYMQPGVPTADLLRPHQKGKKNKRHKPVAYKGQKGHPIRKFLVVVIILGLLGGGGYYGWSKHLRKSVKWAEDLQPTVTFVEKALHRSFDKSVPVVTLTPDDFQLRLTGDVLGRLYPDETAGPDLGTGAAAAAGVAAGPIPTSLALRAVGLMGPTPPDSTGQILAAHTTSFYSGADRAIYRMDGATGLFQVDLLRAFSSALIDQEMDVTAKVVTLTDSQRIGLYALVDGIANEVVAAKYIEFPALEPSMQHELIGRMAKLAPTPVFLFAYLSSYEHGAPNYFAGTPDQQLTALAAPSSDGPVFDVGRVDTAHAGAVAASRSLGMEFWFDALVPTLGVDGARAAMLAWNGDTSAASKLDDQACITSTIDTFDATTQAALLGVMTQWASTRPALSVPTAEVAGATGVTISMCSTADVTDAPTATAEEMDAYFVRADTERDALARMLALGLPATATAQGCAVAFYRSGAITNFDPASNDPEMVAQLTDLVTGCKG